MLLASWCNYSPASYLGSKSWRQIHSAFFSLGCSPHTVPQANSGSVSGYEPCLDSWSLGRKWEGRPEQHWSNCRLRHCLLLPQIHTVVLQNKNIVPSVKSEAPKFGAWWNSISSRTASNDIADHFGQGCQHKAHYLYPAVWTACQPRSNIAMPADRLTGWLVLKSITVELSERYT